MIHRIRPSDIYVYDDLLECMAECFHEDQKEMLVKKWEFTVGGRTTVWPMRRAIRMIRKRGAWGFCHNKKEVHLWIGENATPVQIINVVAHEIGHMIRPWHKNDGMEEVKALKYGDNASESLSILLDVFFDFIPKKDKLGHMVKGSK